MGCFFSKRTKPEAPPVVSPSSSSKGSPSPRHQPESYRKHGSPKQGITWVKLPTETDKRRVSFEEPESPELSHNFGMRRPKVTSPTTSVSAPSEVSGPPSPIAKSVAPQPPPELLNKRRSISQASYAPVVQPLMDQTQYQDQKPKIRWLKGDEIGRGSMGLVFQGILKETGGMIAVKEVAIKSEEDAALTEKIMREVELLKQFDHPNIVKMLGYQLEGDSLEIFLEYVPGGSLHGVLKRFGALGQVLVANYTSQILSGLAYLHAKQIAHRDLKCANVLLTSDGKVKLADFGCSKRLERLEATIGDKTLFAQTFTGSVPWMAPEVISQSGHTTKADIWSVGCLVIEMLSGRPPWGPADNNFATMMQIANSKEGPPLPEVDGEGEHLTLDCQGFIKSCVNKDAALRPTAEQLRRHAFIMPDFTIQSAANTKAN